MYGLGVDQALEMGVVTADGRYRVVSAESEGRERELFWALRGGGGSTDGVVTSVVVKAHPAINLTVADFSFAVRNPTTPSGPIVTINDTEVFWKGLNAVYAFGIPTVDAGGYLHVWTQAISMGNGGFMMQVKVQMPGKTITETTAFVQPLFAKLQSLGIPVSTATVTTIVYGASRSEPEGPPSNMRFASRLFPRSSFTNGTLFSSTMSAARAAIEAGFFFHGLNLSPTLRAGGYSYPSAVNPVWRETVMHADLFGMTILATSTAEEVAAAHRRLQGYMDAIREATPGGGSYLNEADLEEPDWQHAFWGSNYERLVGVKREWDPWGVFWAPATVGSEAWVVESRDGLKSQNGFVELGRDGGRRRKTRRDGLKCPGLAGLCPAVRGNKLNC